MTVHFRTVPDFAQLSYAAAETILYDELLPACEKEGVYLAPEGNAGFSEQMARYQECKEKKTTFCIPGLQQAFAEFNRIYCAATQYRPVAKQPFEDKGCYISGGELMAVMMLQGFAARFQKRGADSPAFRAEFKVKEVSKRLRHA